MTTIFEYKVMFKPTIGKLYEMYQYFKMFTCDVRISKRGCERQVDGKSYIGILSLDLCQYDDIVFTFDKEVNMKLVRNRLDFLIT